MKSSVIYVRCGLFCASSLLLYSVMHNMRPYQSIPLRAQTEALLKQTVSNVKPQLKRIARVLKISHIALSCSPPQNTQTTYHIKMICASDEQVYEYLYRIQQLGLNIIDSFNITLDKKKVVADIQMRWFHA